MDRRAGWQSGEKARIDLFALLLEIAPRQNMRLRHDLLVREHDRRGIALRRPQIGFAELLKERGALRIDRAAPLRRGRRVTVHRVVLVVLLLARATAAAPAPAARRHLLEDLGLV